MLQNLIKTNDSNATVQTTKIEDTFKQKMTEFISEYKNTTKHNSDRYKSLIVLNTYLISQIIDKIDELEQRLNKRE